MVRVIGAYFYCAKKQQTKAETPDIGLDTRPYVLIPVDTLRWMIS